MALVPKNRGVSSKITEFSARLVGCASLALALAAADARGDQITLRACILNPLVTLFGGKPLPTFTEITLDHSIAQYFGDKLEVASKKGLAKLRPNNFKPLIKALDQSMGTATLVSTGPRTELTQLLMPKQKYNFIIDDHRLAFSEASDNGIRDLFGKHRTLAQPTGSVLFAGEMWVDETGILHISNASEIGRAHV